MKKIINDPDRVVGDMLEGFVLAHPDIIRLAEGFQSVIRVDAPVRGKVALISGGGSGHEPAHGGYVGRGMLDGACAGAVFTSPTADQIFQVMKLIDGGKGVFQIIKNYTGDVMNFEMAADMARDSSMEVASVIVNDDVAVEDSLYTAGRRGIAGTVLVHKITGAAAEAGKDLPEVKRIAEKVKASVRSMGFALASCTVPKVGKPTFTLGEREMELGIGIHGEPGTQKTQLMSADEIVQTLMGRILEDLPFSRGDEVAVMINGLGGTPCMELYIMSRAALRILKKHKIQVYRVYVGSFMTSLEMAGASITLLRLDKELKSYLDAQAESVVWRAR